MTLIAMLIALKMMIKFLKKKLAIIIYHILSQRIAREVVMQKFKVLKVNNELIYYRWESINE